MKQSKAIRNLVLVSTLALGVAGCSQEVILEGLREDLRSPGYDLDDPAAVAAASAAAAESGEPENRSQPASLGAMQTVASWTHRGANAQNVLPHATLSAQPQLVWSAKAGDGNETSYRITAEPVAADGRIYTMDAHARVTAFSTAGAALWQVETAPPGEDADKGTGGGLALGAGKLFATTGWGELVALNPASGAVIWRQRFGAPVTGAPTVSGGKVFVATATSGAYALDTETGKIAWRLGGVVTQHGVSGVAAPAIAGNEVLFPLANGSLVAADIGSGDASWVARIAGDRPFRGQSVLQAFTGEPVVSGGTVYVATAAGRAAAVSTTGETRWSTVEGARGLMAVAGGSLYFVNDENKLVRLSAADGDRIWAVDLPRYTKENPRKYMELYPAYGPILAGGKLWVAGGDGYLRGFNPADGALVTAVELPAGAASRPIAVGGMLYVLTTEGDLLALR